MTKRNLSGDFQETAYDRAAPFVRSPYNYDRDAASNESAIAFAQPGEQGYDGKTQQQFTQECDPNFILDRFVKGGDISLNTREPLYGDFTNVPSSYHEALNYVAAAKQSFMQLDAKLRAKFDNDPGVFIDWCADPKNAEEMISLGLATPKPPEVTEEAKEDRFATKVAKAFKSSVSPSKGDKGDKGGDAPQDQ